ISTSMELSACMSGTVRSRRHQPPVADHQVAALCEALLQSGDVDLDVMGDGVAGRQVLGFYLAAAARTVELQDADPARIGRKGVFPLEHRLVDLPGIALRNETAVLVAAVCIDQRTFAAVADPLPRFE